LSDLLKFLEAGEAAARAGGAVLLDWADRFHVREKGPSDLVTEADEASQEAVRSVLLGAFPKHGFLSEENLSIDSTDNGYRWIVDPLDGTTNYVHAIPNYAVSIALEQHGNILVGVVFNPVTNECFKAVAGGGAFLNDKPLRTSRVQELRQAVVAMSFPPRIERGSPELDEFQIMSTEAQSLRRIGSSAMNLCYVAAGRFDAYWSTKTKIWDIAAGVLLVLEAGGIVTDRTGGPFRVEPPHFIAGSTRSLHAQVLATLAKAGDESK
jgi:myo-inositol-1(or 4)-monophosphatase